MPVYPGASLCPRNCHKYRLIDDLWLSYHARRLAWRLRRSAAAFVPMERDGKGLAPALAKQKTEFREMLEAELLARSA